VDLQLSKRGDYTVRAAVALARSKPAGRYLKLREISAEMDIPARYTHEIVSLLVKAGLAEALAGKNGGYRLSRDPSAINFLEIIEAGEGTLRGGRCVLSGGPCHWQETICAVHPSIDEATKAFIASLRARTLAQIVRLDRRLQKQLP
jgi:Rrf2 family protein